MNKINEIIAQTCLKFHDSGETSVNREARLILEALEKNGYSIIKNNMPYSITIAELIERPVIREDKFLEYLNKMTDEEIKTYMDEIDAVIKKDGETRKVFPDWNVATLSRLIDRDMLYNLFIKLQKKNTPADGEPPL